LGCITCALVLCAFGISLKWSVWVYGGDWFAIGLDAGMLVTDEVYAYGVVGDQLTRLGQARPIRMSAVPTSSELSWRPRQEDGILSWYGGCGSGHTRYTPLWLLFAAAAAPTALLWVAGRRMAPGCCRKCGYNLTGNVSGRCPECGAAVSKEPVALARSVGKSAGG